MKVVLVLVLMALVAVLVSGVVLMGVGGAANIKYGNRLMTMRVALQAVAVVTLILMFAA